MPPQQKTPLQPALASLASPRPDPPLRILLIDNHDSYTYNLAHLLTAANASTPPLVLPADAYPSLPALLSAHGPFDAYVVSPGPGTPHNPADLSVVAAAALADPRTPALGVCLGHQALCAAAGARVVRAPAGPVHGRLSRVVATAACPLLDGLPGAGFDVVRYHSLVVDPATLPEEIVPTAWCYDGAESVPVLMAVRHAVRPWFGVQFHPESVLTECGRRLARNFVRLAAAHRGAVGVPQGVAEARAAEKKECRVGSGAAAEPLLRVLHHRVASLRADSAAVFSALYGASGEAFWLDSSSCVTSPSLSRCSSLELRVGADAAAAADPPGSKARPAAASTALQGRFSLMGDLSSPRSELVTYDVSRKIVRVRYGAAGEGGKTQLGEGVCELHDVSVFDYLDDQLSRRRGALGLSDLAPSELPLEMIGGYVGFCGYEAKADVEGVRGNKHKSSLPDAWFAFADRVLVYDHSDQAVYLIAVVETDSEEEGRGARDWFQETEALVLSLCSSTSAGISTTSAAGAAGCVATVLPKSDFAEPLQFVLERDRSAYEADVRQCLEHIASGESYEICLTNRLHTELPEALDVLDIYRTLRLVNPAPYAAFIRMSQDTAICCSSPERFLRAFADGRVESKPIKGTRPRSSSLAEDEALALDLRTSEKDCSENLMIVDLVRNDLGRTCAPGSIAVPVLMQVESYASVHQLVSTVRGRRRDSVSTMRCIREAYPMGSMTGAPKVRTMSLIDGLESSARGVYSGTIGYLSLCGAADMNVVIRTAVVSGRSVEIGVGGAIVALSSPEEEFAEILVKGRPIMQSIALVSTGLDVFDVRDSALKAIPVGDGSSR